MSEQMRQLTNKVILSGKLAELKVTEGNNKNKVPYISLEGKVRFGPDTIHEQEFKLYVQKFNSEGKENKNYPKITEFAAKNAALTIAKTTYEEAAEVKMEGNFAINDYVNSKNELKESIRIEGKFLNDCDKNSDGTSVYDAIGVVEGYIESIIPETRGEDANPTGRLKVALLTNDFFGNLIPMRNLYVESDMADDFGSIYEVGQTAKFTIQYISSKSQKETKKTAFGKMHVDETNYLQMIIIGGDEPFDSDDERAISSATIKAAKLARQEQLDAIKAEGYKGNKNNGNGKSSGSSVAASKAKAQSAASDITDDDIPF